MLDFMLFQFKQLQKKNLLRFENYALILVRSVISSFEIYHPKNTNHNQDGNHNDNREFSRYVPVKYPVGYSREITVIDCCNNESVTLLPSNIGVSVHGYLKNVTRKLSIKVWITFFLK
jgi:hypothetical protein